MVFWTYILRCSDGAYYTGHTDDLERRIGEHQTGGFSDFTTRRRPVELAWSQDFETRDEALSAELSVKRWSRAKKEALIRGDWSSLAFFATPPSERVSTSNESRASFELDTHGRSVPPPQAGGESGQSAGGRGNP